MSDQKTIQTVRDLSLQPVRPPPGVNNVWYSLDESDTTFVLVHGVMSDSHGCWFCPKTKHGGNTYWPDLILSDRRIQCKSIYLGGYLTALDGTNYNISACASELYSALFRPDSHLRPGPGTKKKIVFVCHSMGGIITRYLLDEYYEDFREKKIGLILIASPSYGSALASKLMPLLRFYQHELGIDLAWGAQFLTELDGRFKDLIHKRKIPDFHGVEAYEHHFIVHHKWWPSTKTVVNELSAGRYFGRPRLLRNTDHFSAAKPHGPDHPAHELLVDFWLQNFSQPNDQPTVGAPDSLTAKRRKDAPDKKTIDDWFDS